MPYSHGSVIIAKDWVVVVCDNLACQTGIGRLRRKKRLSMHWGVSSRRVGQGKLHAFHNRYISQPHSHGQILFNYTPWAHQNHERKLIPEELPGVFFEIWSRITPPLALATTNSPVSQCQLCRTPIVVVRFMGSFSKNATFFSRIWSKRKSSLQQSQSILIA